MFINIQNEERSLESIRKDILEIVQPTHAQRSTDHPSQIRVSEEILTYIHTHDTPRADSPSSTTPSADENEHANTQPETQPSPDLLSPEHNTSPTTPMYQTPPTKMMVNPSASSMLKIPPTPDTPATPYATIADLTGAVAKTAQDLTNEIHLDDTIKQKITDIVRTQTQNIMHLKVQKISMRAKPQLTSKWN